MVESEYEIRTDLPSARARRFESDERDLFSCSVHHCSARTAELDEDELATLRHTFFERLFFDLVVVGLGSGDSGASQIACTSSLLAPTNVTSDDARRRQFGVAVFHEPRINP